MSPRVDVLFGTSGESMCHHQFLKAGANGFIEKPFVSLSEFQLKMLSALPESHFFQFLCLIPMKLWNQIRQSMPKTSEKHMIFY